MTLHTPTLFILSLLFCLAQPAKGQDKRVDIDETYSFVQYSKNHLIYDSNSVTLRRFYRKWRTLEASGQGNISVMHIGSSHVQGGTFPNEVRKNLMHAYPSLVSDRGMLFPYAAAANCNNPHDYATHCKESVNLSRNVSAAPTMPMGLCGLTVAAHDQRTEVQIVLNDYNIDYATEQVILIGESPNHVTPSIRIGERLAPPSFIDPDSRRFVFNFHQATDSFTIILPCHQGEEFMIQGIYLGNFRSGFSYHSIGVNGSHVHDYLKCQHFSQDLRLLLPDLVIFGIGINDAFAPNLDSATFHRRYLQLVDSVRSVNPDAAFIFITNNDCAERVGRGKKRHYQSVKNNHIVNEVMYKLAAETGGAVWDQYAIMGGAGSINNWIKEGLAKKDHVHFTAAGYTLLGDLLYNAMVEPLVKQ